MYLNQLHTETRFPMFQDRQTVKSKPVGQNELNHQIVCGESSRQHFR